ncbi:phage tail protein [Cellulomonas chengniuliangii]|uniref:Phage tail protein n=1 Tax=Cellulomonas chengniuliangii TaxID=2968084 RepID=A0ABY5KXV6_9CELL|nr:phage tail protein [Cellulomonas chengniuliangii]MCC2308613.1 phage tail protein [Cellulomonas chengniuliangii]MCC2317630.1 phage tail protein [Cellulomonas chengniuliangii]UUI73975.1 phage tail protein [Cellulomonas chengniuliangii]
MVDGLFTNDPIVAQNFFLEIDGEVISTLISVSGLDIEVSVSRSKQSGSGGVLQEVKGLGSATQTSDLQLSRVAPLDSTSDKLWNWFNEIRGTGLVATDRAGQRKNGSIVLYDTARNEVARFNFFNSWPSKISTDQLSVESTDVVKESITLVIERLERVK